MDSIAKIALSKTPIKDPHGSRSKPQESKSSENLNPNLSRVSPSPKPTSSPSVKSAKCQKSASSNPNPVVYVQRNKIRERKFIVAKKNSKIETGVSTITCKCHGKTAGGVASKCVCVAYENLRASQEDFFRIRRTVVETGQSDQTKGCDEAGSKSEVEEDIDRMIRDHDKEDDLCAEMNKSDNGDRSNHVEPQLGSSTAKRRRNKLIEEARKSAPEPGSGRVLHLVKAFEKLLSIPKESENQDDEDEPEENIKVSKWALPGLQPPRISDTQVSSSSLCPSELFLTSENLGLDSRFAVSSSWDGSSRSRNSDGGRRSRRNSSQSSGSMGGRRWKKKQLKVTSQKPFKLRTEQRGRQKEEEFVKRIQEMMAEEERQRVPVAQGLPWTTDEPECLIKPPVKENTRPLNLVLHSDVRAAERAEFDHQVLEKISLIEQYKMERERQQKMLEEEEVRRLRKELVPKAQPMPYFDRPFMPKRSVKHPTIPKEPKLHIPQHKKVKSGMSWTDISSFTYSQV